MRSLTGFDRNNYFGKKSSEVLIFFNNNILSRKTKAINIYR